MVLCYNSDTIDKNLVPENFKDLSHPKYYNLFSTGSPLASGTNFTTMAVLQYNYGWEYFKKLKVNKTIAQGEIALFFEEFKVVSDRLGGYCWKMFLDFKKKTLGLRLSIQKMEL